MNILEIKNLHVVIGSEHILDEVNFSVEQGETVAIVGPNGAGKTMLFRALLGLIPYQGEIKWAKDQRIGYVPQFFEFDKSFPLTVEEFFLLKMPSSFWIREKPAREKILAGLREVGAEGFIKKRLGEISRGELQRVLIAAALFGDPTVLLFDEPTAGIDIGGGATIYTLLHRIVEERGLTLLLISHDLNVVYQYATSVLCINKKPLCFGIPQKVLTPEKLQELYKGSTAFYTHEHTPKTL